MKFIGGYVAPKRTGGRLTAVAFLLVSFFLAVVLFVVGYYFFRSLEQSIQQMSQGNERVAVVIANVDLHQGIALTEESLTVSEVPRAYLPDTVYHSIQDVVGRTPRERILKGEAIRQERLAQPSAGKGLNAIIPTGQRAQQIELPGASSVTGFVNPGNFVDVLVTGNDSNGMGQTATLLQAVKVLAVDDRLRTDGGNQRKRNAAPAVTLSLTPYDSQRLAEAVAIGNITLTLRNDVDVMPIPTEGMKPANLLGRKEQRLSMEDLAAKARPTKKKQPEKAGSQTVIIQGANSSTLSD